MIFNNLLIIPLTNRDEVIGVLGFTNYAGKMILSQNELETLKNYCSQISSAIFNSHLLKEAEDAKTEAEISKRITEKEKEKTEIAKQEIEQKGLSDIIKFTGHRNDLKNIYASFDLFLMTSLTEGMPNTVLEAMALKLPIVSTDIGGLPELVEEQAGLGPDGLDVGGVFGHDPSG